MIYKNALIDGIVTDITIDIEVVNLHLTVI